MIIDKLSFATFSPKDFSFIRLEKISIFFFSKNISLEGYCSYSETSAESQGFIFILFIV